MENSSLQYLIRCKDLSKFQRNFRKLSETQAIVFTKTKRKQSNESNSKYSKMTISLIVNTISNQHSSLKSLKITNELVKFMMILTIVWLLWRINGHRTTLNLSWEALEISLQWRRSFAISKIMRFLPLCLISKSIFSFLEVCLLIMRFEIRNFQIDWSLRILSGSISGWKHTGGWLRRFNKKISLMSTENYSPDITSWILSN